MYCRAGEQLWWCSGVLVLSYSVQPIFSFIVPICNEAASLAVFLNKLQASLQTIPAEEYECILVDGCSDDASRDIARASTMPNLTLLCSSSRSRARQMNEGANLANGDLLIFLHADTQLPEPFPAVYFRHINSAHQWGYFKLALDCPQFIYSLIAFGINLRTAITAGATGDQVQWVSAPLFHSVGGFQDIPLMEDLALSQQLKRLQQPVRIPQRVVSSARRWKKHGVISTIILMWTLRVRYLLGADPAELARRYVYQQSNN